MLGKANGGQRGCIKPAYVHLSRLSTYLAGNKPATSLKPPTTAFLLTAVLPNWTDNFRVLNSASERASDIPSTAKKCVWFTGFWLVWRLVSLSMRPWMGHLSRLPVMMAAVNKWPGLKRSEFPATGVGGKLQTPTVEFVPGWPRVAEVKWVAFYWRSGTAFARWCSQVR